MKRPFNTLLVLLTLLVSQFLAPPTPGAAQTPEEQAIEALSDYLTGHADATDQWLKDKRFDHGIPESTWRKMPAIRKIDTAYRAANLAQPGGGDKMLALLSKDMAMRYESIDSEASLTRYRGQAVQDAEIEWPGRARMGEVFQQTNKLSPSVRKAITTLADYSSGGALGSPHKILTEVFELDPDRAYDVLRSSQTNREVYTKALRQVDASKHDRIVRSMTNRVASVYEGARYEPALKQYLSSEPDGRARRAPYVVNNQPDASGRGYDSRYNSGDAPSASSNVRGPKPPPNSGGTPGAGARTRASAQHGRFVRDTYPSASNRSFRTYTRGARGFGGVIFGNEVTDDVAPRVRHLSFEIAGGDTMGTLLAHLENGRVYRFPDVHHEDAYAAYQILFGSSYQPGDGIGLVGLRGSRIADFDVVLNPALDSLELGWATIMVDALPLPRSRHLEHLVEAYFEDHPEALNGQKGGNVIRRLFMRLNEEISWQTYKVVDVPTHVSIDGDALSIVRQQDSTAHYPYGLRATSFMELRLILGEAVHDTLFAEGFYRQLPIITQASYDYGRLNRFAAVLALCRWARQDGASFEPVPALIKTQRTPDALFVSPGFIWPAFLDLDDGAYEELEIRRDSMALQLEIMRLFDEPVSRYVGQHYQLELEQERQWAHYLEVAEDSTQADAAYLAFEEASLQLEAFEQRADSSAALRPYLDLLNQYRALLDTQTNYQTQRLEEDREAIRTQTGLVRAIVDSLEVQFEMMRTSDASVRQYLERLEEMDQAYAVQQQRYRDAQEESQRTDAEEMMQRIYEQYQAFSQDATSSEDLAAYFQLKQRLSVYRQLLLHMYY